jgi:sulfur-oxidizing protein SoxZ
MTDLTRIRALATGDKTTVRVLMAHEMESGQRRDSTGKLVPAWHITEVVARHNGKTVLTVMCGPSVSKDPYLQFTLKGARPGDKIAIGWKDNRGATRVDEATVT